MALIKAFAGRPPLELIVRVGLAITAVILGYYGVTFSASQAVIGSDPALAYRLAPYDGRTMAAYSAWVSSEGGSPERLILSDNLAKHALRRDSMAVAAVATLGVNADVRGEEGAARRYFAYAQKLSRRDLRTQLWLIEDAVARGNVSAALREYDITLRVFPTMGEVLFPILASAISNPAIRVALTKKIQSRPPWKDDFLNFAAEKGTDPQAVSAFFVDLQRLQVDVPGIAQARVVDALIAADKIDLAWYYYAHIRSGASRSQSRDPNFSMNIEYPSQFDWKPATDATGVAASIENGIFDFSVSASVGGRLLTQLQSLQPGAYKISGHSIGINQPANSRPYWSMQCGNGREIGRIELPNSDVGKGNFNGTFNVPEGCVVQTLTLIAQPSDAVSGLSGQIDRIALKPVAE